MSLFYYDCNFYHCAGPCGTGLLFYCSCISHICVLTVLVPLGQDVFFIDVSFVSILEEFSSICICFLIRLYAMLLFSVFLSSSSFVPVSMSVCLAGPFQEVNICQGQEGIPTLPPLWVGLW